MRSLADWLARQQAIHARSVDLGLERVTAVLGALGLQQPPFRILTVGGTNGKGSTVAHLDEMLRAHGYRIGAFTSPHLVRYNERIAVDGEPVEDGTLIAAFEDIERARGTTTLTFFEFNALAALIVFTRANIDVGVLEVGLGGRLDAVNAVDADVAVLCSVGLDHRDWLGDTLAAIGREKAGIFRNGRPAVLGTPEMPSTVFEEIARVGALPIVAERDFSWLRESDGDWHWRGHKRELAALPAPAIAGAIQYRNAASALAAIEALDLAGAPARDATARALRSVSLRGRFQIVRVGNVEWILDVAHNEPAARTLAEQLKSRPVAGRSYAVAGLLGDKDIEAIGRVLVPLFDRWIVCTISEERGIDAAEAASRLLGSQSEARLAPSVAAGCEMARAIAVPGDRVVVFGSFHTVGPALEWLRLY